jgi:mannose-6-phosphate isomerase
VAKKKPKVEEQAKAPLQNVIQKPWGHELLLAKNDLYTVKQLFVKAGHRLSLQVHGKKIEHMTLVGGMAHLYLETEMSIEHFVMQPMMPILIEPGTIHRLHAGDTEDAVIIEVSTSGPDEDIIRLDDDFGRADDMEEKQEDD